MHLNEVQRVASVCIYADVVPELVGFHGIGKTAIVKAIGRNWRDPWMTKEQKDPAHELSGIPVFPLYCATQEITDLIGFPIKIWETTGVPVIDGTAPEVPGDRIGMDWAAPKWAVIARLHCEQFEESDKKIRDKMIKEGASIEEIWVFWHRPKYIVFCDEIKRASREVTMAMYPFILEKTLHMTQMPRGTRIVTADNFTGAYDVREPDAAFLSRLCHIQCDADAKTWHGWAVEHKITPRIRNFIAANQEMLMSVPANIKEASETPEVLPNPRAWEMIDRIEKYGKFGIPKVPIDLQETSCKLAVRGLVGMATAEAFWKFDDTLITADDILAGTKVLSKILKGIERSTEQNNIKEKLQFEILSIMKYRPFNKKESDRLRVFLLDLKSKERATGILQGIFQMKNAGDIAPEWVQTIMKGKELMDIIQHLIDKKKIKV